MQELLQSNEQIWDLFTKREEYKPEVLDQCDRFPYYMSGHRNVFHPEVSAFLVQQGLSVKYPDGKAFAVCLTHDIDVLHYSPIRVMYEVARELEQFRAVDACKAVLGSLNKRANHLWSFSRIMDLERRYGAKSSFYFLALARHDSSRNYHIRELRDEMQAMVAQGWEVGLHGSHQAYKSYDDLKREKDRLESILGAAVSGYRNHFLHFEVPTTWELLQKAGFRYDATFGYIDCIGFRNGMCHPYYPFNLNTNKQIDIIEIPLVVMDLTLTSYMRLKPDNAWKLVKSLIDTVRQYQGVFTLLWHNTQCRGEMFELYECILSYCRDKNAWMTSGIEIADWWRDQPLMKGTSTA